MHGHGSMRVSKKIARLPRQIASMQSTVFRLSALLVHLIVSFPRGKIISSRHMGISGQSPNDPNHAQINSHGCAGFLQESLLVKKI
jgi:hypothetical protein